MLETKIDISKTALLVIDMQNDLIKVKEAPFNAVTKMVQSKGAINKTARVIAAARQAKIPVVFTNHVHREDNADVVPTITDFMLQGLMTPARASMIEGTPGAQIVDELKPAPGEHVIWKRRSNAFYNTDLELMLRSRRVDTVIITGVVTNGCIANTVRGAQERDLNVIVISDCVATMMPEDDDYFIKNVFPRAGRVRTADEIIIVLSRAKAPRK
ncbi:MAG: cysteine hydrolase [Dehalococcoidales bacterium]|nr:cysteine hydrolase [Dehalococcoidales bacterium]